MVNTVSSATNAYAAYEPTSTKSTNADTAQQQKAAETTSSATKQPEAGAVYESSGAAQNTQKTYKPDPEAISKMLRESEDKVAQFAEMIRKMFKQQGQTSSLADLYSAGDGFTNLSTIDWKKVANGQWDTPPSLEQITQAKADIADGGYWGVDKTSERIVDFAKALSGGDPAKAESMKAAFEKGFKQATKAWGQKLPDISQKTYDAVIKKFDEWKNSAATDATAANKAAAQSVMP